jgi:hypothetical protein
MKHRDLTHVFDGHSDVVAGLATIDLAGAVIRLALASIHDTGIIDGSIPSSDLI